MTALTLRLEVYDAASRRHILEAQQLSEARGHRLVQPLHLLAQLAEHAPLAHATFRAAGLDPLDVLVETEVCLRALPKAFDETLPYMSASMLELLGRAEGEAARQHSKVAQDHLLLALAQEPRGDTRELFRRFGLHAPLVRSLLDSLELEEARTPSAAAGAPRAPSEALLDDTPLPPALRQYTEDWTALALQDRFDPSVGRDKELRRILYVLVRRRGNNPLLVGEAGVGKTSIVRALSGRIATGDVPDMLQGRRLLSLDTGSLLAGSRMRGQLEERVRSLLEAVRDASGQVLLYISDLERLTTDSRSAAGSLLSGALGRGELQMIAEATPDVFRGLQSELPGFCSQLVSVEVEPPSEEEAIAILRGVVPRFEVAHGISISDPALVAAVQLARRYVPGVQLPKSAIDIIDEAASRVRVELQSVPAALDAQSRRLESIQLQLHSLSDELDDSSKKQMETLEAEAERLRSQLDQKKAIWEKQKQVHGELLELRRQLKAAETQDPPADPALIEGLEGQVRDAEAKLAEELPESQHHSVRAEDVANIVASWTGVPVVKMMEEETKKLLNMEARLAERVVGQEAAVTAVAKAVRRGRVGLRDPRRPIGSFLFLGPTGVGKTELAKALAEFLFDDEHSLTRLDMSEFMEKHMVARLLGSPPGYVDSEDGGFLTEAVRRKPYSVVLFDEMEKAHPDVFNILLQVLDDGRLTDSRGRVAYFRDTVIIMTSNVGGQAILHAEQDALEATVQEDLHAVFRPEFLNRVDDVVIFNKLSLEDLRGIVDIQLRQVSRLLSHRGLELEVSGEARSELARLGYQPAFGARPLKRVILKKLQDPLAEEVLRGGYQPGDRVRVDMREGTFTFEHERPRAAASS